MVEEIARIICRPSTGCSWDWIEGVDRATLSITRIGNAVLSGEYPELDRPLGVVGRGVGTALVFEDGDVWATWTEAFAIDKGSCKDNDVLRFLALRKGNGAGEEGK